MNNEKNPDMNRNEELNAKADEKTTADQTAAAEETQETVETNATDEALESVLNAKPETEDEPAADAKDESGKKAKKAKAKKEKKSFNKRKFRFGATATATTIVVVAAMVLLNVLVGVLFNRFPLNLDLTKDKTYTVSQQTKDFAKSIKNKVDITVFSKEDSFVSNSSSDEGKILLQFHEAAKQYNQLSGGKVSVEYVDLTSNPQLATKYQNYGVQAGNILFRSTINGSEKFKVISMDDLATSQTDYTTYQTTYDSNVETTMANKINAVTSGKNLVMAVLTGHDEDDSTLTALTDMYGGSGYDIQKIAFASNTEMPKDCNTAIIAAPQSDFSESEIQRLREWLSNDGKMDRSLLVFAGATTSADKFKNLNGFLKVEYGIEITDNLVAETDSSRMYSNSNPFVILADKADTDYTKGMDNKMVLGNMMRQLKTTWDGDISKSNYTQSVLTMPKSTRLVSLADINDEKNKNASINDLMKEADNYPMTGLALSCKSTYDNDTEGSPKIANYVMVTTNTMLDTSTKGAGSFVNVEVMNNIANAVTHNDTAVNISSKTVKDATVSFSAATQNWLGMGLLTIGIPLITLIIGLIVFIKRRHL